MAEQITKKDLEHFIHKNRWFQAQTKNDPNRCQFSVYEHNRAGDFHQCQRKPVETIDGIGFCKTHLKEVKRRLGIDKAEKIRFAAYFDKSPSLCKLEVVEETLSTIDIKSVQVILGGSYGLYVGSIRKDSRTTNRYSFFDDVNSALDYLTKEAQNYVRFCESELEKANNIYANLLKAWFPPEE